MSNSNSHNPNFNSSSNDNYQQNCIEEKIAKIKLVLNSIKKHFLITFMRKLREIGESEDIVNFISQEIYDIID